MKFKLFLLTGLLAALIAGLGAQMTSPRLLFVRITEADGSPLADTTGLAFQATLHGISRDAHYTDFGFFRGRGDMYAKLQLGNFGIGWEAGDTVNFQAFRNNPYSSTRPLEIEIPEGGAIIWWGRPPVEGKLCVGYHIRMYPYVLNVQTPSVGIPVFKDGKSTGLASGSPIFPDTQKDLAGVVSLAPPPAGYRWEPSKYLLTLRDFEFSESAYTDAEGVAQPGWARTLEFRLVPSDPEG